MEECKTNKLINTNQSVEKALKIIELMASNKHHMRLQDIAEELHMSPTTVLRFLYTLMQCGYVEQNSETLKYYLTLKICNISDKVKESNSLSGIAKPYLIALSKKVNESVCLAVERDMTLLYIDFVEGPDKILRTLQRIGTIAPLHCTGIGKLILLDKNEKDIDRMINEKGLKKFTKNTCITKEMLMNRLNSISKAGYALDDEECEIGAKCVAAPIRDYSGKIIAGISITGSVFKITDEFINEHLRDLFEATNNISHILGYAGNE